MKDEFYKVRYSLSPQLKEYDLISSVWKPYVMFFNKTNYKSEVYNLDKDGFRFNNLNIDMANQTDKINSIFHPNLHKGFKKFGVVIGNSTAFGIGSSNDEKTIPGILSNKTDTYFFNMACSAYNGFQETIIFQNFINYLNNVEKVIVFSGLIDVFMTYFNTEFDELFDSHYFSRIYLNELENSTISFKKKMAKFTFEYFSKEKVDWKNITIKQLIKKVLSKKHLSNQKEKILSNSDRKKILTNIVKKNLKFWHNYQVGTKTKVIYVLQPLATWCEKKKSSEEEKLFSVTDSSSIRLYKTWADISKNFYSEYKLILEEECNNLNIEFLDCNSYFDKKFDEKWLFNDRIHLTDLGNEKVVDLIKSKF